MSRLRSPVFTVLALIAACGGKVLVDSNSGGDQGGGQAGSTVVLVGSAGTSFGTAGSVGTSTGTETAGAFAAGGFYNTGGASTGSAGGFVRCGPAICPVGTACCNAVCGICSAGIGGGCPNVTCGTAGSSVAGAFGTGGSAVSCSSPDVCMARIPGPLPCPAASACLCNRCSCPANNCFNDPGCQQIWSCALKFNCRTNGGAGSCLTPQTCQKVIEQNSGSLALALQLEQCMTGAGCDSACGGAVDAGPGCRLPPPAYGAPSCSGQVGPGLCDQTCVDSQMNTYVTECSGNSCACFYDGQLICSCAIGSVTCPGTGCCPGWTR